MRKSAREMENKTKMCMASEKTLQTAYLITENAVRLSNYKFYVITDRTSFPQLLLDV